MRWHLDDDDDADDTNECIEGFEINAHTLYPTEQSQC